MSRTHDVLQKGQLISDIASIQEVYHTTALKDAPFAQRCKTVGFSKRRPFTKKVLARLGFRWLRCFFAFLGGWTCPRSFSLGRGGDIFGWAVTGNKTAYLASGLSLDLCQDGLYLKDIVHISNDILARVTF